MIGGENKIKFRECLFYEKQRNNVVKCVLCPNFCLISDKGLGICRTRKNLNGKLVSLSYGYPIAMHIDPIEKKPIYDWMPGTHTFSIGTAGCNLRCMFCQNYEISQISPQDIPTPYIEPEEIVSKAIENKCPSISYTYTDPIAFYEYVLDTAKIARKKGLKNVLVTNGYINPEPTKKLLKFIDAANVDFKAFDEEFYRKVCGGKLKPVLGTMKLIKKMGIHIEVTNLLIEGLNADEKMIRELCKWVKKNLDCPIHFSRFFPMHKMSDKGPTKMETLLKAEKIAKEEGLKKVYLGNV